MSAEFRLEPLDPKISRQGFTCGEAALDGVLSRQATQDLRRRVSACFVAIEARTDKVAGFYTLAAASVPLTDLPPTLTHKLPRYPSVPVARVGRLAVDTAFRGRKLGAALLADAALRAMRSEVAVFALVVDAKNEAAEASYRHHGFERFAEGRRLIVSLKAFRAEGPRSRLPTRVQGARVVRIDLYTCICMMSE